MLVCVFFFQAEDGIRDLVRSRGLGDVYKRQEEERGFREDLRIKHGWDANSARMKRIEAFFRIYPCLLYTSDAADERSSVDLGGRRIIKKKTEIVVGGR